MDFETFKFACGSHIVVYVVLAVGRVIHNAMRLAASSGSTY